MAKQGVQVAIPAQRFSVLDIVVVGESPLLTHRFSETNQRGMLDKQQGKANSGKEKRDPEREFRDAIYRVDGMRQIDDPRDVPPDAGEFGLKAACFKAAMVRAGKGLDLTMVDLKTQFIVLGDVLPIQYESLTCNVARCKIGRNMTTLRYRPQYNGWSCHVPIKYDEAQISQEQVINLLNRAGQCVGVGDWIPARGGNYGMFHVTGYAT